MAAIGLVCLTFSQFIASLAASDLSLQGKLDALRTEFEANLAPPPVVAALHRAKDELIASGATDRALKTGDLAPTFTLLDAEGKPVSTAALLARGPLVVTFYRGVWCPYCNLELQALEAARPQIEARGASLLAVSQQTAANSRKSQRQNKLGFPIMSDPGGDTGARFGVRWTVPPYLREIHRALGADLTQFNGDNSWTLSMPARYVIGGDGVIAYAEINPDYTRRPDPADLVPVLDAFRAKRVA